MNRRIVLGLAALVAIGVSVATPATAEARHGWGGSHGGSHGGSFGGFFSRGGHGSHGSFGGLFSRGSHGSCGSHGGRYTAHNGCWGEKQEGHTDCGCGMDSHIQDSGCGCGAGGGYSEQHGDVHQDMNGPTEVGTPSNGQPAAPAAPNGNAPQEPSDNNPRRGRKFSFGQELKVATPDTGFV